MSEMAVKKYFFTDGASNRIFEVDVPLCLIHFCEFNFEQFMHKCAVIYDSFYKQVEIDYPKIKKLKKEICNAHPFIKNNIETIFDKIIVDCWIHLLCTRNSIDHNKLWNTFSNPKTDMEKLIFERLCDLRYRKSINEWCNIINVQSYAIKKIDYIFNNQEKDFNNIKARRSFFNMSVNLAAREMGLSLEDMGEVRIKEFASLPNAPFITPPIAKTVFNDTLSNFDYEKDYGYKKGYNKALADEKFLLAYSQIKDSLPQSIENQNNIKRAFLSFPEKIYLTDSFRAIIDFEIDEAIFNNFKINKCKRCLKLFSADKDDENLYCIRDDNEQKCREVMDSQKKVHKPTSDNNISVRSEKCAEIISKMRASIGIKMSIKEFTEWYSYFCALQDNVAKNTSTLEELENFLDYSEKLLDSDLITQQTKSATDTTITKNKRVIKKFNPPRISRATANNITSQLNIGSNEKPDAQKTKEPESAQDSKLEANSVRTKENISGKPIISKAENPFIKAYLSSSVSDEALADDAMNVDDVKDILEFKSNDKVISKRIIKAENKIEKQSSAKTQRLLKELENNKFSNPIISLDLQEKQRNNATNK